MEIVRAVILAVPARDERPWSSTGSTPKALVPIATRPILFHTLDALSAAGVQSVVILTPPETTDLFGAAVGDGSRWDMRVVCRATLAAPGVEDALGAADESGAAGPVVIHQAGALLRTRLAAHLADFAEDRLDALALMVAPGRIPLLPPRPAAGYLLSANAVALMRGAPVGSDPIVRLRRRGGHVRVLEVEGCLACHGDEATLLEANRHALTGLRTAVSDAMLENCELQGPVVVHPTARLRNTLVRGPAMIGAGSTVIDSYIGPYTSIGAGTRIEGTEIEHSIVMDDARLLFVGSRLETSIIGRGASIARRFGLPSAVRLSIGDGADVALS
jgi:glucose-1-phosphate thymidylyltransferase